MKKDDQTRGDGDTQPEQPRTAASVAPSSHTPGPWRIEGVEIWGANNQHVVWELGPNDADSSLIAAAPDLLAALKARLHDIDCSCAACGPMQAAIAKAEGRG